MLAAEMNKLFIGKVVETKKFSAKNVYSFKSDSILLAKTKNKRRESVDMFGVHTGSVCALNTWWPSVPPICQNGIK